MTAVIQACHAALSFTGMWHQTQGRVNAAVDLLI